MTALALLVLKLNMHLSLPKLWKVSNLREWNLKKHTHKLISPLPDIDGMVRLRLMATGQFHTTLYAKTAFERIHLVSGHCKHATMLVTMLDDDTSVVNHIIQWHLFRLQLPGVHRFSLFMEIHLDDIVIDSDKLNEPMDHVRSVLNMVQWVEPYLSQSKLHLVLNNSNQIV